MESLNYIKLLQNSSNTDYRIPPCPAKIGVSDISRPSRSSFHTFVVSLIAFVFILSTIELCAGTDTDWEQVNEELGIPLFSETTLWEESAEAVAMRLELPLESLTNDQSSYRLYRGEERLMIAGATPASLALYGLDDKVHSLSIIFANKGDIGPDVSTSTISDNIANDAKKLATSLTKLFGDGSRDTIGRNQLRVRVLRWDWEGHSFLLTELDGEYTALQIWTTDTANNRGIDNRMRRSELSGILADNITKEPNGDVVIRNIPMTDQGPKGYCVPATFERYLRYMYIPADMYLLAMADSTGTGGGTHISTLVDSISRYVSSLGRTMKPLKTDLSIRRLKRHIDKGLPIIWRMMSTEEYNLIANKRTVARASITDWSKWAAQCEAEDEEAASELSPDPRYGHVCLIIGYNEETGELCVSDSWGKAYEFRWVTVEQAKRVSGDTFYIIDL